MKVTIDAAGRLVIPSEIRKQAGLRPGMQLNVRLREGRIELEPATLPVRLEQRGRFLVAVPEVEVEPLTTATVEEVRQSLLDERSSE
jgi:AbrB family looped-hinge helix DNA binding protein